MSERQSGFEVERGAKAIGVPYDKDVLGEVEQESQAVKPKAKGRRRRGRVTLQTAPWRGKQSKSWNRNEGQRHSRRQ